MIRVAVLQEGHAISWRIDQNRPPAKEEDLDLYVKKKHAHELNSAEHKLVISVSFFLFLRVEDKNLPIREIKFSENFFP